MLDWPPFLAEFADATRPRAYASYCRESGSRDLPSAVGLEVAEDPGLTAPEAQLTCYLGGRFLEQCNLVADITDEVEPSIGTEGLMDALGSEDGFHECVAAVQELAEVGRRAVIIVRGHGRTSSGRLEV